MKKNLLVSFILIAIGVHTNAQSLIANNPTLIVYGTDSLYQVEAHVWVVNQSNNTLDVHCYRTSANLAPGHTTHFCWEQSCYGDTTTLSTTPVILGPGDSSFSFFGDLNPWGHTGTSTVSYCFFNAADFNDQTCLTFQYVITPFTGIEENNQKPTMTLPKPNPSDKFTIVGFSIEKNPGKFYINLSDTKGSLVASYPLKSNSGFIIIPTENIPSGIYFCSLNNDTYKIATEKLVVVHH